MKNNPVCKENASNVFRKEREQYHEIQDLKAQMQDKNMVINELKKLILVTKGKSVIVQLILFIVDSGCTKHMTGNLKLLYLIQGNVTIKWVYYIEGLNHNLFSVGQFCDADLEVAFRKSTCFVRDLRGNDLLTDNRGSDLYIISLQEMTSSTLICFMAKASPTQLAFKEGCRDWFTKTEICQGSTMFLL
ncbi:hypothetical protein Tco_1287970 [Tanacetum coccineum]